jgi:hypothetical protein
MNGRSMPSGRSQRLADSKDVLFVAFESNSNYKSNSDTGVYKRGWWKSMPQACVRRTQKRTHISWILYRWHEFASVFSGATRVMPLAWIRFGLVFERLIRTA